VDREEQHLNLPAQPFIALGQMLAVIAAMQQDQAEANREFLEALQVQTERQTYALEQRQPRRHRTPPPGRAWLCIR